MNTYNLFISHSWSYSNSYDELINLLNNRTYFTYRNYSVPKDDPIHNAPNSQALYDAIQNQMRPCHIILVLAGVYATYSSWIQKEIHIANNFNKPIIGIRGWGSENISDYVRQNANEIVSWNSDSIVEAIRRNVI